MTLSDARLKRGAVITVLALVALRLVVGAITPITFDEAYYWTWSKHLAGGYYDHPPMVAYIIRLGTMIAGDTEFGVRVVSILLALPMSYAVYRAAEILFGSVRVAASAAIFLNITLMASVGTIIVTPDAPLIVASSFVLFFLAKIHQTGNGAWWLAVGAAAGCALLSKYTAMFFGASIVLWLIILPELRRWFASPWLYLGGIVALVVFSPVIVWNANHEWVSFIKQLGRARVEGLTLKYVGEMIPVQAAFATPLVFVLGIFGLIAMAKGDDANRAARMLIACSFWVIFAYFMWHALHQRVEANWFGPIYPAFAIAAAYAAWGRTWKPRDQRTVNFSRKWALLTGVFLFLALIAQTNTGILSGYKRDASVRSVGVGWRDVAQEVEGMRKLAGAQCILTKDYGSTSWLMFYMPKGTCIAQRVERYRWSAPPPERSLLAGTVLLFDFAEASSRFKNEFARIEKLGVVERKRSGTVVETYDVDVAEGAKGDPLTPAPPPELLR